jgi:hypothetical protein
VFETFVPVDLQKFDRGSASFGFPDQSCKYWGKDSSEEVVFASHPRELNFVLKRSRGATR